MRKFALVVALMVALALNLAAAPAMAVNIPMDVSYSGGVVKAQLDNASAAYNLVPIGLQYQVADQADTTGITHYMGPNTICEATKKTYEGGHLTYYFESIDFNTWNQGQKGYTILWGTQSEVNTFMSLSSDDGRHTTWSAMNYTSNMGWSNLDMVDAYYSMGVTDGREGKALQIFDAYYYGMQPIQ